MDFEKVNGQFTGNYVVNYDVSTNYLRGANVSTLHVAGYVNLYDYTSGNVLLNATQSVSDAIANVSSATLSNEFVLPTGVVQPFEPTAAQL